MIYIYPLLASSCSGLKLSGLSYKLTHELQLIQPKRNEFLPLFLP
jgi:hypothetical protein